MAFAIVAASFAPRTILLLLSQLVENVLDQLAQVFVDVAAVAVESLGNVLECLEEAVEVHLGVFATFHHILVYDVVMGLCDVRIRHGVKLGQPLELVRRYEVVVLLPGEHLEDCLRLRVEVELVVVAVCIRKNQLEQALLGRSGILRLRCGIFALLTLRVLILTGRLVKNAGGGDEG